MRPEETIDVFGAETEHFGCASEVVDQCKGDLGVEAENAVQCAETGFFFKIFHAPK